MKKKQDISYLFREVFQNFQVTPSSSTWERLSRKLWWQDFLHFRTGHFNIYYATGIAILSFFVIMNLPVPVSNPVENSGMSNTPGDTVHSKKAVIEQDSKLAEVENTDDNKSNTLETFPAKNKQLPLSSGTKRESGIIEENSDTLTVTYSQQREEIPFPPVSDNLYAPAPMAYFSSSYREGCVPLQVKFTPASRKNIEYEWTFGDGGSSEEENPLYIFDEPGKYLVTLSIRDNNNQTSIYIEEITVHPMPTALFELEAMGNPGDGQPVYFYNYSRGAEKFLWDFGDGTSSYEKEPVKIYEQEGDYNIRLVVYSSNGCSDTAILINAFRQPEPQIVIPSAFSPNPNGPVGGYYTGREGNNDVFHPYTSEEPMEFNLKVFNRRGYLIFESKDHRIGWDGYYREALQPAGVYVWKLRMRFADGKQVVKMGDVTLIKE